MPICYRGRDEPSMNAPFSTGSGGPWQAVTHVREAKPHRRFAMRILSTTALILAAAWLAAAPQPAAAGGRHPLVSRYANDVYAGILYPHGKPPRHGFRPDHTRLYHLGHPRPVAPRHASGWRKHGSRGIFITPRPRPHAARVLGHAPKWTHRHKLHRHQALAPHHKRRRPAPLAKLPPHRIIHHLQGQRWTSVGPVRDQGRTYTVEAYDRRLKRHTLEVDAFSGNVLRVIRGR
jgi:hypothetical protein